MASICSDSLAITNKATYANGLSVLPDLLYCWSGILLLQTCCQRWRTYCRNWVHKSTYRCTCKRVSLCIQLIFLKVQHYWPVNVTVRLSTVYCGSKNKLRNCFQLFSQNKSNNLTPAREPRNEAENFKNSSRKFCASLCHSWHRNRTKQITNFERDVQNDSLVWGLLVGSTVTVITHFHLKLRHHFYFLRMTWKNTQ